MFKYFAMNIYKVKNNLKRYPERVSLFLYIKIAERRNAYGKADSEAAKIL